MKAAIVYWSGTGNTEAMAQAVAAGVQNADVSLLTCSEFDASMLADFDAIAFGCPSMGAEELEETEFEPMFSACEGSLSGKRIALFGSYGWGDGEWMRNWADRCTYAGAVFAADFVICQDAPDADAVEQLKALGAALTA